MTYIATHVPLPPVTADQLLDLLPLHVSGPLVLHSYIPTNYTCCHPWQPTDIGSSSCRHMFGCTCFTLLLTILTYGCVYVCCMYTCTWACQASRKSCDYILPSTGSNDVTQNPPDRAQRLRTVVVLRPSGIASVLPSHWSRIMALSKVSYTIRRQTD